MTTLPRHLFEYIIYYHCLVATASSLIIIFGIWSVNDWIPPVTVAIIYLFINILFAVYIKVALDLISKIWTFILYEVLSFIVIILSVFSLTFLLLRCCTYIVILYILISIVLPLIFKFGYALLIFPKCWWQSRSTSTTFETESGNFVDSVEGDYDKPPTYDSLDGGLPNYDEI